MRFSPLFALLVASLTACGTTTTDPPGEPVEQLEAAELSTATSGDGFEGVTASGMLSVTGAERDFSLTVATTDGDVTIDAHLPGMSAIGELAGRQVSVELSDAGLHQERALVISDSDGAAFLLDDGWHRDDVEAVMGQGFVDWGETVSSTTDEQYEWSYTTAVFQTDEGEVALLPGEAETITVDGQSWRVVVIGAYQVTPLPDAALPCGGISDLLSYELMRVDAPATQTVITRPSNATMAHLGCL